LLSVDEERVKVGRREANWLCPTLLDRERLVDMNERVAVARRVQGVTLGVSALAAAPFYGFWLVGLIGVAGLVLLSLERVSAGSRRPEFISAVSILVLELVVTAAAAGTGGARSPMLGWLIVPIVMLAARFPSRVVGGGVTIGIVCALAAVGIAELVPRVRPFPPALAVGCWLALLASMVAATIALLSAEMKSRGDALIDPLTGLPNRLALATRLAQTASQAANLNAWVSIAMLDIDHFKNVNDTHGHDVGDHVLRTAAYEMRRALRTFDAVYRLGGEEFLVLLPGVSPSDALDVANRLRVAVAERPAKGVSITISGGVSGALGAEVDTDLLIRQADEALYTAKHGGRDQVFRYALGGTPDTAPAFQLHA
jgi:diguanylate cyclase (GGDEF)-like protein